MADPALWFPGSARLSISSSSLHLSAAAEPGPHHPACQSPLYTFNPSYPSLCKAASRTAPLLLCSKQPPSTEALRSSFNSHANTHSLTPAHCSYRQNTATRRYRYGGIDTQHMNAHTQTGTHTLRRSHAFILDSTFPSLHSTTQFNNTAPHSDKPFTRPSTVNLLFNRKRVRSQH